MGLDMYLEGRKNFWTGEFRDAKPRFEDGFPTQNVTLRIGYWRKHPNLHGYIVQTFANGEDECQPIYLSEENIDQIIAAVKAKKLPDTTGFFFGRSDGSDEEIAEDVAIFEAAKKWLNTKGGNDEFSRSVIYQASW